MLAHVPSFGRNPRGSPDFLAYPVPKACMHVLGTRVPRRLGVARSASSPKAAQALGCSLTPGLRISFGRVTCMARAASVPGLWALGFLLLACVCGWVRVAVGRGFCLPLPVVAGVLGGCVWARFVVLSLFCRLFVVFVVGLWCGPAFGTCVVSCAFPLPPAVSGSGVRCGRPGLGCAPLFLARLSGCVFCAFLFFFFFRLLGVLVPGLVVSPPSPFFRAGLLAFFFFCLFRCPFFRWAAVAGLVLPVLAGWSPCACLGVMSSVPSGWGVWPPSVLLVGGLVAVGCFPAPAPPPLFFFFRGGGPAGLFLPLPSLGWRLLCGWCVVWLVPRHSWQRFLCATPRHSWLGFAAGGCGRSPPLLAGVCRRRWCLVCGGGVLVGLWLVCGVVGPSPLLAEVPVCYSPPLLAGFRFRWCWAGPATPGWGPLAALLCGVWCVAVVCWWGCGWCVVWLVPRHSWRRFLCATPRHSWLGFAAGGGGRSPPLLAGVRLRRWCVVCGVWCVVCGGGVWVGLWLVYGVVGPSPLLAEVAVCYSPPLLAGFRCRWWWAVPATPGWGPLAALLCGVWCVAVVCWWGCGWCVVWLVPRHSWRRFLCATPRHSWLGFAAGGGGRSPPLLAGVRLRRWCVVCGVWCVAVVCWWGCGWCVVWLVPRHSWRRFLCATPRHSWLGFAAGGGGRSPPLLAGVRWRRCCVVCGVWRWCVGGVVAGVWCGWSLATPGGGSCVLLPATPGWVSLPVVVGGPRHSWLGSACGGGVWCVVCGVWRWCVGGVVAGVWCGWSLATPGGGSCVLLPATPGWVSLPLVVGGPRHSWLGSFGGGGVWCVVWVPRHSWRRFLCATPRHSWLGFAAAGGGRSPPLLDGVRWRRWCACFAWPGRAGRPPGRVVVRLTFSFGRFVFLLCLAPSGLGLPLSLSLLLPFLVGWGLWCVGWLLLGTCSCAVVLCVLCALSGFVAPGGRRCLAPVRVPWLWPAACLSGVPRGPAWCAAPRPVRSLSVLRSAFPTPWCLSPPRELAPPALLGSCAGHAEAGREPGSLCLPLAPAEAGALGSLRVVPIRGPAMGLSLAGPSGVGLGLRALRWLACVDPVSDASGFPYRPSFNGGLGRCTGAA